MTRQDANLPHRKNAAEWAMWVALQPLRWFLILRTRLAGRHAAPDRLQADD
jgi:hypothetical protein